MGGRRVRTKYTVQDRHLQMEKEDKEKKTQEQETERRTNDAHTEITETPLNTGVDEVDAAPAGPVAEEAATTEIVGRGRNDVKGKFLRGDGNGDWLRA